ncbi:MAG: DMT family transporter [Phyllobacteriaceae bacterium]|nr:DMT family transporter [Phyllobacteriaceae bacterium]
MSARSWAMLILLGALWGGSFYFARIAVMQIEPFMLVAMRVAIAAAALWIWLLAARIDFRPMKAQWAPLLFLALINNVIPFSLIFIGQTAIGAGLASIMNATTPFWTALIAWGFAVEARPAMHKFAGIAIGVAGAAVMLAPGMAEAGGGNVFAKLAVVGAAISYGFAATFARRFRGLPPTLVATGQLTGSTLLMIPVVAFAGDFASGLAADPRVLIAVAALALASTAFAYVLYFRLIATAGATNAALVTLIVPVSALLLGVLLLGEKLALHELVGMGVILFGLLVIDGRLFARR